MEKHIWIINEYAGSIENGMTYRHYYLAKELINKGYNTTIITGSYSHFLKKYPKLDKREKYKEERINGVNYLWVKVMKYNESFDKKRILKWFQFVYKLFFVSKYISNKPSYIICSPTAPFSILSSLFLARKHKAKLIFEVRDIWPLTLIELGGYKKQHPFIVFMSYFEKLALKKADILVSNLQNYSSHIKNLGLNRKVHWVSNGVDLTEMDKHKPLSNELLNKIPKNKFIVGYTGKLGVSNALDDFIEAARLLKNNENIIFVLVGKGQEKEKLQEANLRNVLFIDFIKKNQIQSMLSLFDICYIGYRKEKLYEYGVSPNKIFDYMLSGKPIIFGVESGGLNIIEKANCGKVILPENAKAIVKAILSLYNMGENERNELGNNGKNYVVNNFTYGKLADKYINIINEKE
ncbi:glycosyltransferase family 4 protein [Tenacibaculum sp. 1B UA]|uniref:glycosyltransferase family 4 protein n=1 Tax=Tenacibaculum sp. 1B UA TaxID=2922252 RepID=UPI002A2477C1|nr:glycosyltransferase family 4 protein [Tenacibaculum sp. 1B UA]MDX8553628.1 glycosyltransferase family 4 protein [Tenacibaculum sp. 1B UA]